MIAALSAALVLIAGCREEANNPQPANASEPVVSKEAHPLPANGFKAQITLVEPPAKLRVGQKETIRVKITNASDVQWYSHGGELNTNPDNRFYLAVGNRWLKSDGTTLVTNMDGRHGIQRDLKPSEEEEVSLQVTAPKEPGDYFLDVDAIQEKVAWFSDKGSPAARTKITVVR
jgi:hypothetical protein